MKAEFKANKTIRALLGVGLCGVGLWLALSVPAQQHTFRIDGGGCRLITDIVEPAGGTPQGYVVLFHGLAANKRIMSYLAEGFSQQGLRVFVPDLPGHGRTDGPFSFDRADQCAENLVRELMARGFLDPERTILAGHSMGGAIALRVASRLPVGGVVAISPAPMNPIPGIPSEAIPFHGFGALPAHSLVMYGTWEPSIISSAAQALAPAPGDATSRYVPIPRASHVSILFDGLAMSTAQTWTTTVLHIERRQALPSRKDVIGFFLGFAGILTLAGAFLREMLQDKNQSTPPAEILPASPKLLVFLEFAIVSLGAVALLRYWIPLRILHLFEGDYFASLLLIVGIAVLALHWNSIQYLLRNPRSYSQASRPIYVSILLAGFAALMLFVLSGAWIDLSFIEAWPSASRVARFLPFLLALLPCHIAEELVLGPVRPGKTFIRLLTSMSLRLIVLLGIVFSVFFLHSGEILPVLLATSFGLFSLGQRWGMDVVREVTNSPAAAALFGAILLAGFCLVVFPTT